MVNKRAEERREDGNEGIKEGERGESDAAELRRTQPMGQGWRLANILYALG